MLFPNTGSCIDRSRSCRSWTRRLIPLLIVAGISGCAADTVRVAAFNIWELRSEKLDDVDDAGIGLCPQLCNAAEIIQRVRPDILLIMEIDFDPEKRDNAKKFISHYLRVSQHGQRAIDYPYQFFEPVNCGEPTGLDLDNDGRPDGPADAQGYGNYVGEYGMALLSRYPIDKNAARTFRLLLWKDMPGNLMPDGSPDRPNWYSADEIAALRLSHKSHWDVPVQINGKLLHVLCTHPTPQIYDGPEDWNGRRNFDEIRFWAQYISGAPDQSTRYIRDDRGKDGILVANAKFVILGDLNGDPIKHGSPYGVSSPNQLLDHPRIQDPKQTSIGGLADFLPGPPNCPERRTHDFGRIDYVLPSIGLRIVGSGVFWPAKSDPLVRLVDPDTGSSDHRLVWVDLQCD